MEIVVVANVHRSPIITEYLGQAGQPYHLSLTPDLPLPAERDWPNDWLNHNTLGAYRCYMAHRLALSATLGDRKLDEWKGDEVICVFEDDARPHWQDWFQQTAKAADLLKDFEVVSLHGRRTVGTRHKHANGQMYAIPTYGKHGVCTKQRQQGEFEGFWTCGSLAYLVSADTAYKIIALPYDGMPMDLVLVNRFKAAIIEPSPFLHDRQHGSLVENPK